MQLINLKGFFKVTIFAFACAFSSICCAAGFQLFEEGTVETGSYHAGGAASANSATTTFYNPAGLVRLKKQQIIFGGAAIADDMKFSGTQTETVFDSLGPIGSRTLTGTANTSNLAFVPNFHYALPINKRIVFGFGITTPFGLETDWSNTILRYAATESKVETINLSPNLGIAITKKLSIGIGFDAQYLEATFNQAIDLTPSAPTPTDVFSKNNATGWGFGYNGGILYQITPNTRIGASYRSSIHFNLHGNSVLTSATGAFDLRNGNLSASTRLPAMAIFSIYHRFNHHWAVMASAYYTLWHVFKSVTLNGVVVEPDKTTSVTLPENFRNTWNVALGGTYTLNQHWLFRSGIGFDETATNNTDRNVRLPGANQYIVAVGVHYQATPNLGFDLGFAHIFFGRANINTTATINGIVVPIIGPVTIASTTVGHVDSNANILAMAVTYKFDRLFYNAPENETLAPD